MLKTEQIDEQKAQKNTFIWNIYMFFYNINVFTVTFDQMNGSPC